jgi:hypothetical protein
MPPIESAFGLALEIEPAIALPGLGGPGEPGERAGRATRVRLAPEELERRWAPCAGSARRMRELEAGGRTLLTVDLAEPAGYLLAATGVARVLVSADGGELLCDPDPRHPDWTFILSAQALPLASTLSGFEVLHASGVVLDGGAVLFAGDPGAGKSSLAAALVREGAGLLGDDAIALRESHEGLWAYPGAGSLYLRAAERDRLTAEERRGHGAATRFAGRERYATPRSPAAPLAALFLLERAERGPALERLDAVDPFDLLAATFNLSVRTPARLTRQLDLVGTLAEGGLVHRLRIRPDDDATGSAGAVRAYLAEVRG